MRKLEDINGVFLGYVTGKAWIWCVAAALVTAAFVFWFNNCRIKAASRFTQTASVFIRVDSAEEAQPAAESEKADYKIMRVAFDSEKEDAVKARYYEIHSRNTFLPDYMALLSSGKFQKTVQEAYLVTHQKKAPNFSIVPKITLVDNGKGQDLTRFIAITVVCENAEETNLLTNLVLAQFKVEAQKLLGFANVEVFEVGPVSAVPMPKRNLKLPIALALLAAVLVWILVLIIQLKRSPVLNEEDILFTLDTPALTRVLRKKGQILPESAELCCRMLEKEAPEGQILIVTAPVCRDFESQAALAVAKGFAALGHNTLWIDCASANGSAGISDLIEGKNAIDEILEKKDAFTYIPRGSAARITTAHLNSKTFRDLVADMRMQYKTVIIAVPAVIDSPAVSLLDDVADSVVLMTRAGYTQEAELATAVAQLKNCRIKKVNTVLFS